MPKKSSKAVGEHRPTTSRTPIAKDLQPTNKHTATHQTERHTHHQQPHPQHTKRKRARQANETSTSTSTRTTKPKTNRAPSVLVHGEKVHLLESSDESADDDDPRRNDPLDDGLDDDGSLMSKDEPMVDDSTEDGPVDDGSDASDGIDDALDMSSDDGGSDELDSDSGSDDSGSADELEFERKARRTVSRLAAESAANEDELRAHEMAVRFALPTAAQLREEAAQPPDMPSLRQRISDVVEVLGDFRQRRQPHTSRADYLALLVADTQACYGYNGEVAELLFQIFSPAEAIEFIEASEKPRPVTVRTNTLKTRRRELAQSLISRGMSLDPISKWSREGLQVYESAVPVGATPEYLAGQYMVQSASSFLPVLALGPRPGDRVLDMAAAPGGKTSHLAALMGNQGTLVANDANKSRMAGLQGNLARLGVTCAIVVNADGRDFPRLMGGFDRVLLDAPCSGMGVISKDQSIKAEKGFADIQRCQQLQKELLLHAIDSCNHKSAEGGFVVYSTCSITVEENEAVVAYALASRCVKLCDTGLPFGADGFTRYRSKRFPDAVRLTKRYYPHAHNMDGFFVAKLRKYADGKPTTASEPADASESEETDDQVEAAAGNGRARGAAPVHGDAPRRVPKKKKARPLPRGSNRTL